MKRKLLALRRELGGLGMAALALMAFTAAFSALVVEPLEKRNAQAVSTLRKSRPAAAPTGEKVGAVHAFLGKKEETTDWLAKLHGIGRATGVELRSATYRSQPAAGGIERYEIVLPASGSYSRVRDFLKRALAEIPVLSLDQMTLRRESRADGTVNAELRLTLHKVKP